MTAFDAAALKAWRERMDLSQTVAAKTLGCARNSLLAWEAGRYRVPHYIGLACAEIERAKKEGEGK